MQLLLSSNNGGNLFFYAIIGLFIGLAAFYHGLKQWLKFKKVADTPTSKVRSMAAGLVELNGKVTAIKQLVSPVSKAKCVYYKVEHQIYIRSKNGGSWVTTSTDTNLANFLLEDDTGKVEIAPQKAELDIPIDKTKYYGFNRRDLERFLALDDPVYVLGTAKTRPGVKTAKNADALIVTQGEGDKFFYITDKKEKDVQHGLSSSSKWSVVGGIIITALSAGYLIFTMLK